MLTINELSKRTDTIVDAVLEAKRFIDRPLWTNGFGVLSDPSSARSNLVEARSKIDAALQAFRNTTWPSDADYDRLESAQNSTRSTEGGSPT